MPKIKPRIILFTIFVLAVCFVFYNTVWSNRTPKFKFTEFRNISEYEFMYSDMSSVFDINDNEVLYSVGEYNRQSDHVYNHSLTLGNISDGSITTLTTLEDNSYIINAHHYLNGYLISYVTNTFDKNGLYSFFLVYLNNGEEILIDSYKGEYASNGRLDFEILGDNIVYTRSPAITTREIVIYNHKLDTREIIKFEDEVLLDTDIKSADNLIAYFVDMGDQAAFDIYNIESKEKTRLPFNREYRLYDYGLTTDGIIASIASEPSPDYSVADDKKAVLFIPFKGKQTLVDTDLNFFLDSNEKICIGRSYGKSYYDELFVFNLNSFEVTPIEMENVGEIYGRPVIIYSNNGSFYIKSNWVYKNYDTEEKIVKMKPY